LADTSNGKGNWTDEELDLIVAEYFSMLSPEPGVQRGWKTARLRKLDKQLGRGEGSIGRKLSNITFVASRLGLPPLPGYGALENIQQAIYPAIDRYLIAHPTALADDAFLPTPRAPFPPPSPTVGTVPTPPRAETSVSGFGLLSADPIPPLSEERKARPKELVRLVRKYDPAARDERNRILGKLGEEHVLNHEIARLIAAERMDLAKKVEWTSDVYGDGAGYDIKSFEPDGTDRLIEVKSTKGGPTTDFFVTRTEREVSLERPDAWRLYRLHTLPKQPRLFVLQPPLERSVGLQAENWRASFTATRVPGPDASIVTTRSAFK
jgi:Domain of unknown function (DUF3883)